MKGVASASRPAPVEQGDAGKRAVQMNNNSRQDRHIEPRDEQIRRDGQGEDAARLRARDDRQDDHGRADRPRRGIPASGLRSRRDP